MDASYRCDQASLVRCVTIHWCVVLTSMLDTAHSPEEAELKAIMWASKLLLNFTCAGLMWSSSAQSVVNDINGAQEPVGWFTRHLIPEWRSLFKQNQWSITWNARSTNRAADAVAKLSLATGTVFMFNASSLHVFPSFFTNVILDDLKAAGLTV